MRIDIPVAGEEMVYFNDIRTGGCFKHNGYHYQKVMLGTNAHGNMLKTGKLDLFSAVDKVIPLALKVVRDD